jgi:hypothetical protein
MTSSTAELTYGGSDSTVENYKLVPDPEEWASDEADDLVAALLARERLDRSAGEAVPLEDAMRAHGFDPADFGLE